LCQNSSAIICGFIIVEEVVWSFSMDRNNAQSRSWIACSCSSVSHAQGKQDYRFGGLSLG